MASVFRNLLCQLVVGVQEWQEQDISILLHLCVDVVLLLTAEVAAANDKEGGVVVTLFGQGQPGVPGVVVLHSCSKVVKLDGVAPLITDSPPTSFNAL